MNTAIIYYSRGGKTESIAKKIQVKTNGDLIKIEPNKQYGSYLGSVVSVAKEKIQGNMVKPTNEINDFSKYDVIFIGFPVWYHTMPTFVQDYLSKCNLKGKRVIPFVTASANGKESSLKTIKTLLPDSNITNYFFTSALKKEDEDAWLNSITF